MPIYAYRCGDCGHAQDFLQKMSDPLIAECPHCKSANFLKQVTAAGFQLKGGGWYVTDFRDNGKKDGKKSGEAATGATATPAVAEGKSETKSESKSGEGGSATPAAGSTPAASPGASSSSGDSKVA
jgi:putative FmdB family regulatory protein